MIWVCAECDAPCTLEKNTAANIDPQRCPFVNNDGAAKAKWNPA